MTRFVVDASAAAKWVLPEEYSSAAACLLEAGFQNRLLLEEIAERLGAAMLVVWINREVPANDGGISLVRRRWRPRRVNPPVA